MSEPAVTERDLLWLMVDCLERTPTSKRLACLRREIARSPSLFPGDVWDCYRRVLSRASAGEDVLKAARAELKALS